MTAASVLPHRAHLSAAQSHALGVLSERCFSHEWQIRELLAAGRSARYLLPQAVLDYIQSHDLYHL